MSFPNYRFVGIPFLQEKDNWKDLGECQPFDTVDKESDKQYRVNYLHPFCGNRVHVGSENGELFKFCPVCLIKLKEE